MEERKEKKRRLEIMRQLAGGEEKGQSSPFFFLFFFCSPSLSLSLCLSVFSCLVSLYVFYYQNNKYYQPFVSFFPLL